MISTVCRSFVTNSSTSTTIVYFQKVGPIDAEEVRNTLPEPFKKYADDIIKALLSIRAAEVFVVIEYDNYGIMSYIISKCPRKQYSPLVTIPGGYIDERLQDCFQKLKGLRLVDSYSFIH